VLKQVGFGISGGLIAGTLVGLGEAVYVLAGASTGEYGALLYAVVLYGVLGMGGGLGLGVGLALFKIIGKPFSDPRAWTLGFLGVFCALGLVIAKYVVNKAIYLEQGVPLNGLVTLLAVFGSIGLLGLWLGKILLTRTPFKILLQPKGTIAAYGALALLAAVFSISPDDTGRSGVLAPQREQAPGLKRRPNFLVIMVDTLRADHLGSYGFERDISPNIDDLAEDSVVFEAAFTSASWTRASTASLFTGMVPSSHSCDVKVAMLPDDVTTIAEVLQGQGYITGGLPNNINVTRSFNFQQGFDWFDYQAPEYIAGATESASQLSMYNVVRKVRDRLGGETKRIEHYYQPADTVLANAKLFIQANQGQRWFTWVHLMEPHDPYFERPFNGLGIGRAEMETPPRSLVTKIRTSYEQEITWMDVELGKFFEWMKGEDLYDQTTIIITSDHGEEFLEHGGWWHGTTLYDEQLHVPLIVKLPGQKWAGTRVPWQVRQLDTPAAIAMLAGAPVPPEWQADDLFEEDFDMAVAALAAAELPPAPPATDGEAEDDAPPAPILPSRQELTDKRGRIVLSEENFEGNVLSSVRSDGYKYIRANQNNPRNLSTEEMYNVRADPGERDNLVGKEGPRQVAMSKLLRSQLEQAMRFKVAAQTADISMEDCERMRALGYVEGDCAELVGAKVVATGATPSGDENK
jgi:arylsulfatase A-like enzyme